MATGFRSLHRRMGATIIAAGLANIFQGMYLLCVPLWVQIGQVVLIALVLIGYVLYRPPAAKRPAGAATSTTEVALDLTSPKALATSHLQAITVRTPLDALGLFSSVASTFGNVGQGNYAAANAYLDAVARSRRRHGALVSSLQIPAVSGSGMGATSFDTEQVCVTAIDPR